MLVKYHLTEVEMYLINCMVFSKSAFVSSYYKCVSKFISENLEVDEVGLTEKQMIWLMKIKKDLKIISENRKLKKMQLRLLK